MFFSLFAHAQTSEDVHGIVKDAKGNNLQNVVCKLLDINDSTLSYAITRSNGTYRLTYKIGGNRIMFSKVGYRSEYQDIEKEIYEYDVHLYEQAVNLQEVVVKTTPITRNNDTLRYNINSFRQKGDLYIEDVIKRLPGISVDNAGQIYYQGKNINKLNIEGIDLMGSSYNQATKNMPAEAVSQIQVIENNQPIRALEEKVHNDKATLNIKLNRNFKMRPFGEILGMIGIYPTRWDNHINIFKISPKNQFFGTFRMNNQGEDYSTIRNSSSENDIYLQEPIASSVLYGSKLRTPPLSPLYYLQNKSVYTSINYLHAFTRESTLKLNVLYHHNSVLNEDSTFQKFQGIKDVILYDANSLKTNQDFFKGKLYYELNNKFVYIQESLTASLLNDQSNNNNNTNNGNIQEDVSQRSKHIQNTLSVILNRPERLIQFSSILRYYQVKEHFQLPHILFKQNNRTNEFFTRNRIGSSINLFGNPLICAYIMEYKHTDFQLTSDTLLNHSSYYWLHTIEPIYEINLSRGGLEIHMPIEYISYNYTWKNSTQNRWLFSPAINFHHKIGNYYNLTINASYNKNANTKELPIGTVLFRNYRTLSSSLDSLSINRMSSLSTTLSYLNTSTMFSWSLYAGFVQTQFDTYMNYSYYPDFTYISPTWGANKQNSLSLSYSLMKVFRKENITIRHKGGFVHKNIFLSQNDINDDVIYNAVNSSFSINWNKLKWLQTNFIIEGNITWKGYDDFSHTHNILRNFYSTLRTDIFPSKSIRLFIDFSQATNEISSKKYLTLFFINSGGTYNITPNLSLEFSALNLLNKKYYAESIYTGANYMYYHVPLRGREITIGAKLRF